MGSAVAAVVAFLAALIMYSIGSGMWPFLVLLAFAAPLPILKLYVRYLYAKDHFKELTTIVMTEKIIYYSTTILMIITHQSLLAVLTVYFGTQLAYNTYFAYHYHRLINRTENVHLVDKELVKAGFKFTLLDILVVGASQIDKILLPIVLSLNHLAIYGIALIIPQNLLNLTEKLSVMLLFKKTHSQTPLAIRRKIIQNAPYLLVAFLIAGALLWFLVPVVLELLFPAYIDSIPYAQVLSVAVLLIFFTQIVKKYMESHRNSRAMFMIESMGYGWQLVGYLILIPLFGLWGAVVAKVSSLVAQFIYAMWKFSKI